MLINYLRYINYVDLWKTIWFFFFCKLEKYLCNKKEINVSLDRLNDLISIINYIYLLLMNWSISNLM